MGVRGIARDLAAAGARHAEAARVPAIAGSFDSPVEIRIEDPGLPGLLRPRDPRGQQRPVSPDWLQRRLKAVGQRPISALVDITNFFMLDLGGRRTSMTSPS